MLSDPNMLAIIMMMIIKENVYQRELKIQRRFTQDYCNTGGRMNFTAKKKKKKQEWFLTWDELVD